MCLTTGNKTNKDDDDNMVNSQNSLSNLSNKIIEIHNMICVNSKVNNKNHSNANTITNSNNSIPSFSDILKTSTNASNSVNNTNTNRNIQPRIIPSIFIENVSSSDRNIEYIKTLFTTADIDPNTIMQITFRSHFCNIILSSPCASDSLLRSRSLLAGSKLYDKLFIRPYLDMKDVKVGRLYYHVFKSNLLPGYKSIFNNRSNKYELRKLIILNDKTLID